MFPITSITKPEFLVREAERWVFLSIATLAAAGVLALIAVIARTPGVQSLLQWPWQDLFAKIVVIHVNLSTLLWILSLLAVLVTVATARIALASSIDRAIVRLPQKLLYLAVIGVVVLMIPALSDFSTVSLNNYIPVLEHPLFYTGLEIIAISIASTIIRLFTQQLCYNDRLAYHLSIVGLVFILALMCFLLAFLDLPEGIDSSFANERLFWGGGHVLQFVNTALAVIAWWILIEQTFAVVPVYLTITTLWLLAGAALLSTVFYVLFDTTSWAYREAFTQLLRYGLVAPPLAMVMLIIVLLLKVYRQISWRDTSIITLILSFILFITGGFLGYFLGINDTRTPAHYHAIIGSINISIMGVICTVLLPFFQKPEPYMVKVTLILYGSGQLLFSLGLFVAGMSGIPRKTAGVEQGINTTIKTLYMSIYGSGGIIAVTGGILFIWLIGRSLLSRKIDDELLS